MPLLGETDALQEAIKVIVGLLHERELKHFYLKSRKLIEMKYFLLLVACCCHIHNDENMSVVQYDVAVKRPFDRCMATGEDMISD